MATEVTKTIKPGGGGDYVSLNAWEPARQRDLVAADEIEIAECYSGGNCQTANLQIFGWTTDDTRFIRIKAADGHEYAGTGWYDKASYAYMEVDHTRAYNLYNTGYTVELIGMQVLMNTGGGTQTSGKYQLGSIQCPRFDITNCLLWHGETYTGGHDGAWVYCVGTTAPGYTRTTTLKNNILYHQKDNNFYSRMLYIYGTATAGSELYVNLYNNTFLHDCDAVGSANTKMIYARTNAVVDSDNNVLAYIGTGTHRDIYFATLSASITKGAGDATTNTEATTVALQSLPWTTATFEDVTISTAMDLTPVLAGALVDSGTNLSGTVDDDILGLTRPSGLGYDIGAIELTQVVSIALTGTSVTDFRMGVIGVANDVPDPIASGRLLWVNQTDQGQSFKGCGGNLIGLQVWLAKSRASVPSDDVSAVLKAHSGTYGTSSVPTGAVLATSTNTINLNDDLDATVPGLIPWKKVTFWFDGTYMLDYDTPYCIYITGYTGTISSYSMMGSVATNYSGNAFYYLGGYTADATEDVVFTILADNVVIPYDGSATIVDTDQLYADFTLEGEDVALENIWNAALTSLGSPLITSTSDGSAEATIINDIWEEFFEPFLTDHLWNSAKTTATLSTLVDSAGATVTPPTRWAYAYSIPSDMLQAIRVNGMAQQPQTEVQCEISTILVDGVRTKALFTNQSTCELEYVCDIGNQVTLLHPKTRQACAALLAAHIASQFGKDEAEIEGYRRRAEIVLADARAVDSQENTAQFFAESPLLAARRRRGGRWA